MALLSNADRIAIWAEFMRLQENINGSGGAISKADLRAAIDAVDQWCEDNTSSFNTAIPLPARTSLSARQKSALLRYVTFRRWEVS
jgi:hypothetical protein